MKKYVFAIVLGILFAGFFTLRAHALYGVSQTQGYFSRNYSRNHFPSGTCGGSGWSDVFCGGLYSITGRSWPYKSISKADLENFIEGKLNDGNSNAVGAAFIISTMSGKDSPGYGKSVSSAERKDWETLLNQDNVTLGYKRNYSYDTNTAYASDINDDVYYSDPGDSGDSLIIYQDGNPVYALQIVCANPIGGFSGIAKPKNHDPKGSIGTITCTAAALSFSDDDGGGKGGNDTYAYAKVAASSSKPASAYSGTTLKNAGWTRFGPGNSGTLPIAAADRAGGYSVFLYVQDVGSAGDGDYHKEDTAVINVNCEPTGHVSATCSLSSDGVNPQYNITATYSDANGSKADPTTAYLYWGDDPMTTRATPVSTAPNYVNGTITFKTTSWHTGHNIWLAVKDVGPGKDVYQNVKDSDGSGTASASQPALTAACKAPAASTANCPLNPAIATNTDVTVILADKTSSVAGNSTPPPAYATTPGATYKENVTQKKTTPTKVADTSSGGSRVTVSLVSPDKINSPTSTYGQTKVDFKPLITAYPYDANKTTVTYTSTYQVWTYKASTSPTYFCGGSNNGSNPTCTDSYNPCSGDYAGHDGNCYAYNGSLPDKSGKCAVGQNSSVNKCVTASPASCSGGYTLSSQPSNGSVGQQGESCSRTYTGTKMYAYPAASNPTSKSADMTTPPATADTPEGACYPREYKVTGVVGTPGTFTPTAEDPTGAQFNFTTNVASIQPTDKYSTAPNKPSLRLAGTYAFSQAFSAQTPNIDDSSCVPTPNPLTFTSNTTLSPATPTPPSTGISSSAKCDVTNQPLPVGDQETLELDITGLKGYYYYDKNGNFVQDGSTIGEVDSNPDSTTGPVENEPYIQVFGGDVSAGNGFTSGGTCNSNSTAQITTYNTSVNPYGGSGTDLAALAAGKINGFATAQASLLAPKGLSFANSTANQFGGEYGAAPNCVPDYYAAGSGIPLPSSNLASPADTSGSYSNTSAVNNLSGNLAAGNHILLYVHGDVFISGNIVTSALGVTDVGNIPSFTLVVKGGNIYVGNNVTNLSGNYIAQPDGGVGGSIYTCASSLGAPMSNSQEFSSCGNKLTVNGSFVANSVHFNRLGDQGSLRFSDGDSGPGSNNASEEFDYTPYNWLAQPPATGKPPKYDSITSLPPVL